MCRALRSLAGRKNRFLELRFPTHEVPMYGALLKHVVLERTGPAEATVGMISLPIPRPLARNLCVDHAGSAMQPVGWWERHALARRAIVYLVDDDGVPDVLRLTEGVPAHVGRCNAWQLETQLTLERESYTHHSFAAIERLRGVPAHECATAQAALHLTFQDRTLVIQAGATGPKGGPYYWESVQADPLWANSIAQAVRVGGVIYNEDTYLWGDFYLVLFRNGVADVAAHFVNTKLHIKGYDFQGLPLIKFGGDAIEPLEATVPADGLQFDLGRARLNLKDSAITCSQAHPGRLQVQGRAVLWYPVSRTFNPQRVAAPPTEWAPGFARTFRFQLSLSGAPPLVARYRAPAWWYAVSGEPWPWGYLPVKGRYGRMGEILSDCVRAKMVRGRFDGGSGLDANDGDAGVGMMHNYYYTGRPELFEDALASCYYWADLAVDHTDFTAHQWVGGWGWKTCAYTKFRDVLYGYLETGDPYLLDVAEMTAEAYWTWYRSNWPRCSIGRDNFELGGWALLWRFLGAEHAKERTQELIRMTCAVLDSRGSIGGQMGAGPHPGYLSSLYMTAVSMLSMLDAAEAAVEAGEDAIVGAVLAALRKLHIQFNRDDREMFPSNYGSGRKAWGARTAAMWAIMALRIYPEIARIQAAEDKIARSGLSRAMQVPPLPLEEWAVSGRYVMYYTNPIYADAMLLGARVVRNGIEISPLGDPAWWPAKQVVATPFGELRVALSSEGGREALRFEAEQEFPVIVRCGGTVLETTSKGGCTLEGAACGTGRHLARPPGL